MDHRTLQLNSEYISKQQWSIRFRSVMGGKQVGLLLAVVVMLVVNFDCGNCNSQETVKVVFIRSVTRLEESESVLHHDSRSVHRSRRSVLNSAEIQEAINVHNRLRRLEGSSNMELLIWDNDLANTAERSAQSCIWSHSNFGQNLYTTSDQNPMNLTSAIEEWYNEKPRYNNYYSTNTCQPLDKPCLHYSQVVWGPSRKLGCAYTRCSSLSLSNLTNALLLVCNYDPVGNIIGQKPYLTGPGCSRCTSGSWWCNEGLCDQSCTASGLTCGCAPMCLNFATVNSATCSCSCPPGWQGSDCSVVCEDTDPRCTQRPGQNFFPASYCTDTTYGPATRKLCPKLCNLCKGFGDSNHSTSTKPSFLNILFVWLPWLLIYRFRSI